MVNSLNGSLNIQINNSTKDSEIFTTRDINEYFDPKPCKLSDEERFKIIKSVVKVFFV